MAKGDAGPESTNRFRLVALVLYPKVFTSAEGTQINHIGGLGLLGPHGDKISRVRGY